MIVRPPQVLSDCETYEYSFRRVWDPSAPPALWVMLNPSDINPVPGWTDMSRDGQTVARCKTFSQREGCGSLVTGNVFAYRTRSPALLARAEGPVGPDNDAELERLIGAAGLVIAAWGGDFPRLHAARVAQVEAMLRARGAFCLGRTAGGHPRHPSRLPSATPLLPL